MEKKIDKEKLLEKLLSDFKEVKESQERSLREVGKTVIIEHLKYYRDNYRAFSVEEIGVILAEIILEQSKESDLYDDDERVY